MDCPPAVFLIVILKSPVIGLSAVSGLRCANEIPVTAETAKIIAVKRRNVRFMMDSLLLMFGELRANYQKERRYSRQQNEQERRAVSRATAPSLSNALETRRGLSSSSCARPRTRHRRCCKASCRPYSKPLRPERLYREWFCTS